MNKYTPFILIVLLAFIPDLAQAQLGLTEALCDGTTCSACHLTELVNRLIKWLIGIVVILFAVLAVWAGFGLVTSGGNPSALQDAKSRFTNAFIGFLIVLSAWLIVDTLMRGIVNGTDGDIKGYGPWSQIECATQSVATTTPGRLDITIEDESGIAGAPLVPSNSCNPSSVNFPGCLESDGGQATPSGDLVQYQGRGFDSGVVGKVQALHEAVPGLRLSGGHRTPERNRQVKGSATSYHLSGRAADFVGTAEEMRAGKSWADANGAVETLIHNAGSGTHLHVAF